MLHSHVAGEESTEKQNIQSSFMSSHIKVIVRAIRERRGTEALDMIKDRMTQS